MTTSPTRPAAPSGIGGGALYVPRIGGRRPPHGRSSIPPPAGVRTAGAVLVPVLLDQSGSTAGTDPHGLRRRGAWRALRYLHRHAHGCRDQAAILPFAERPFVALGPTPLHAANLIRFRRAIHRDTRRQCGEGTAFVPVLKTAAAMCGAAKSIPSDPLIPVVIWVTDGLRQAGESVDDLRMALEPLGAHHVHLIALDRADDFARVHDQYGQLQLGSIHVLHRGDGDTAIELAMGEILVTTLGMVWVGPKTGEGGSPP